MNFNIVGSLLAVTSAHETVHIFKLAKPGSGGAKESRAISPSDGASIDSRDGATGTEGGYEAFIDGKKSSHSISYVYVPS